MSPSEPATGSLRSRGQCHRNAKICSTGLFAEQELEQWTALKGSNASSRSPVKERDEQTRGTVVAEAAELAQRARAGQGSNASSQPPVEERD